MIDNYDIDALKSTVGRGGGKSFSKTINALKLIAIIFKNSYLQILVLFFCIIYDFFASFTIH